MDWFRWHTGSATDPKFRVVARKASRAVAGVRLSDVLAVWAMLLERASESEERGMIDGFDFEGTDAHLDMPEGAACAIYEAMEDKGLIEHGRIAKWNQRQPKREDSTATERKRAQREREAAAKVTHDHDMSRTVTHGHDRGEEIRGEESKILTPPPDSVGSTPACAHEEQPSCQETGGGVEDFTLVENPTGLGCQPWAVSMELQQIAEIFPEDRRDFGEAEIAMKALSGRGQWPGMHAVMADLAKRSDCDQWTRENGRFVPSLSKYIRGQQWKNPIPSSRASPPASRSPEDDALDKIAQELRKEQRHELPQADPGKLPLGAQAPGPALPSVQAGRDTRPPGRGLRQGVP